MSQNVLDQPTAVRPGETLDAASLAAYLRAHVPELAGAQTVEVEQFPSGHSNLTYLVRVDGRELVLRRPPFGVKIKTAHDMGREYRILASLAPVYAKTPRPLAHCEDLAVLGAPFYVMERLQGVILRTRPPAGVDLTPTVMRGLSEAFVDNLVEIHRLDVAAAGLDDLGNPAGYVQRQVEGWTRRYANARTDDIPVLEQAARWLADHLPAESGGVLIHNDYKYDNLVLDPANLTHIVGVLDWEMATIGDPLLDLGTSLGYWVDPDDPAELHALPFGLTALPGNLNRRELAQRYAARSGRPVDHLVFLYVYGLFKIAVIVQQIYARYKAGLTQDRRFASMGQGVRALGLQASQAIAKGRIDNLA